MKCPKCSYVSHDYLDACRKCGVELVSFKKNVGLLVLQPGVLDLGLALGEAGGDDPFGSMGEEITRHAGNNDDFEISLDDDFHPAAAQQAYVEAPRARARAAAEDSTGLDHLTLELDVSALPAELAAMLPAARPDTPSRPPLPAVPPAALPDHLTLELDVSALPAAQPDTPSRPPLPAVPPAALPDGGMRPGDVTLDLDIEPDSASIALPSSAFADLTAISPPDRMRPEDVTLDIEPDSGSIALPSGAFEDLTAISPSVPETAATPVERPETTESVDEEQAKRIDPTMSVFELLDVDFSAVESSEAESGAEPLEVGESVKTTLDSFEPTVDDALFVSQANEPSGSDLAEVVEPDLSPVDAPGAEQVSLWSESALSLDTSDAVVETALMDLAMPTLDDATLEFTAEDVPPPQPSHELAATADEAPPKDALTSADISPFEDLEEPAFLQDFTLELSAPDTGPEQGSTTLNTLALGDRDDTTLPGHLTLDFDISAFRADLSSATPDDVRLDDPPGDIQSAMSPPQNEAGAEEELLLDPDNIKFDDDTKA